MKKTSQKSLKKTIGFAATFALLGASLGVDVGQVWAAQVTDEAARPPGPPIRPGFSSKPPGPPVRPEFASKQQAAGVSANQLKFARGTAANQVKLDKGRAMGSAGDSSAATRGGMAPTTGGPKRGGDGSGWSSDGQRRRDSAEARGSPS